DGELRAVQLDADPRREVLVSRDCGGTGCLPDWWVIDCASGGLCDEAPLVAQQADVRIAEGGHRRRQAWAMGADGVILCFELVRGRPEPCPGWREVPGPVRQRVAPSQPPGPGSDGKVVASVDVDLDADGRAEHVACAWQE